MKIRWVPLSFPYTHRKDMTEAQQRSNMPDQSTDSEKRIQAFETKCLRKLLRISYLEHKTNDWVQSKINFLVDLQEPLLAAVTRRKLA